MSLRSPPIRRRGTKDGSRDASCPDLEHPKRVQQQRFGQDLESLLSSQAVPNMPGTVAHGEPAAITSPGLTPAATSPATDHFAERREDAKALLLASAPRPSAAETILYDVASREVAIYFELSEAQEKLARELHEAVTSDVRGALALSKVLREVTQISGAIGRRVEHVLSTATALRAQRRFLELQGGRDES